jgi:formylglycine-generating enzyme required for sulfatase activity
MTMEGNDAKYENRPGRSWTNTGFHITGSYPAVCVSWDDAVAYADWLSGLTGKAYRLPTEAEFEYAARANTRTAFSFGNNENDLCKYGNTADESIKMIKGVGGYIIACNDGYAYTSPVCTYAPNKFGLYDMQGNAWQWTVDCSHPDYQGAPTDGSAWTTGGNCLFRMVRGGAWFYHASYSRAATHMNLIRSYRSVHFGFRVARSL